jgi:alpha-D-ribose 1-methylphosphonate 5-triphosphate synthase subunit PhnG
MPSNLSRHPDEVARGAWPRALTALSADELQGVGEELAAQYTVTDVSLPQAGLALVQMRDGAFHEHYYLGETPIARAHVHVRGSDGREAQGAAQILDDRAGLARTLALLDAVLAARLPGWERVARLVERGRELRAAEDDARRQILARTRVDFATLGATEEEDE